MPSRPTVAIDFDGVLHPYTAGYIGPIPADEPPAMAVRPFLQHLTDLGYRLVIFSARAMSGIGRKGMHDWLDKHDLARFISQVTGFKPAAVAYIDDRAIHFDGDFARCVQEVERLAAMGHNEPR